MPTTCGTRGIVADVTRPPESLDPPELAEATLCAIAHALPYPLLPVLL